MNIPLTYVAHPVGAPDAAGVRANIDRALRWYEWLVCAFPDRAFVMPWLAAVLVLDDERQEDRARGRRDGDSVLARCDAIVLVGGQLSRGMAEERDLAIERSVFVIDLLALGDEPPAWRPRVSDPTKGGDHGAGAGNRAAAARPRPADETTTALPTMKPQNPGAAARPIEQGAPREPSPSSSVSDTTSAAPASTDATGAAHDFRAMYLELRDELQAAREQVVIERDWKRRMKRNVDELERELSRYRQPPYPAQMPPAEIDRARHLVQGHESWLAHLRQAGGANPAAYMTGGGGDVLELLGKALALIDWQTGRLADKGAELERLTEIAAVADADRVPLAMDLEAARERIVELEHAIVLIRGVVASLDDSGAD